VFSSLLPLRRRIGLGSFGGPGHYYQHLQVLLLPHVSTPLWRPPPADRRPNRRGSHNPDPKCKNSITQTEHVFTRRVLPCKFRPLHHLAHGPSHIAHRTSHSVFRFKVLCPDESGSSHSACLFSASRSLFGVSRKTLHLSRFTVCTLHFALCTSPSLHFANFISS